MTEIPITAQLANWRVADVMSAPIPACAGDLDVVTAARLMLDERIHAIAVMGDAPHVGEDPPVIGVLSDLDLVAALEAGGALGTLAEIADEPVLSIPSDATLNIAARQMRDERTRHLIVVAPNSGRPVGVLSTLDIIQVVTVQPNG